MSVAAADVCSDLGMTIVYWSAWGLDWERADAARIADVASEQLDDGGILLLHDSARFARRPSAQPTADAIPLIAERAQARGIRLIALRDAVAAAEADTAMSSEPERILLVASPGGHLLQMLVAESPRWSDLEHRVGHVVSGRLTPSARR